MRQRTPASTPPAPPLPLGVPPGKRRNKRLLARETWRRTISVPPIESPFLDQILEDSKLPADLVTGVRKLAEDGYVIFDLGMPDIAERAERIMRALYGKYGRERRVSEAWYFNEDVRAIAAAPHVLELLGQLYQREAIPFQTLNFEVGTQQPAHSDTIHFNSLPQRYMCGVWVALEDIHLDAGPLIVYPGSHRLPAWTLEDLGMRPTPKNYTAYEEFVHAALQAKGFRALPLLLKRGEAVLWTANLYHGGGPIRDRNRTRCSQATHYYFEDCQYFFPMQSDLPMGRVMRREVIDIRTGKFVPHKHHGEALELGELADVCLYPRPLPKWVEGVEVPNPGRGRRHHRGVLGIAGRVLDKVAPSRRR